MLNKLAPFTIILIGLFLVIIPKIPLENFVRSFLKNFGLRVETKQVNLTKLVVELIRFTGAILIGVGLIMFFVLPYYSMVSNF